MQVQFDKSIKDYFDSLPPLVQESIRQSGLSFQTAEEMKSFVTKLKQK
ncbi:MAG: hypothetical protein ACYCX2_09650 [Christensenellales bacterium]